MSKRDSITNMLKEGVSTIRSMACGTSIAVMIDYLGGSGVNHLIDCASFGIGSGYYRHQSYVSTAVQAAGYGATIAPELTNIILHELSTSDMRSAFLKTMCVPIGYGVRYVLDSIPRVSLASTDKDSIPTRLSRQGTLDIYAKYLLPQHASEFSGAVIGIAEKHKLQWEDKENDDEQIVRLRLHGGYRKLAQTIRPAINELILDIYPPHESNVTLHRKNNQIQ